MIESALVSGFTSVGMDVFQFGPLPTPAVAMLTRSLRADLGVMISASHNQYHDNGIKLFGPDGQKLSDEREREIEALMDEEIHTIVKSKLAPYHALGVVSEALPALGIVAAVLGVIKAMGALDQSPKLLGGFIGAALVGTFAGIFLSYGVVSPFALKIKMTREKRCRPYIVVKQTLLAFMNGAMPQIAIEHGRKMIASTERPSIDVVENETIAGPSRVASVDVEPKAARA